VRKPPAHLTKAALMKPPRWIVPSFASLLLLATFFFSDPRLYRPTPSPPAWFEATVVVYFLVIPWPCGMFWDWLLRRFVDRPKDSDAE
jgi:hypothetical protein